MASWRPNLQHGRSCDDCRLKERAIDAVVRIMESKSCTDITYRSTDEESLKSKSEASLVMKGGSYNDSTRPSIVAMHLLVMSEDKAQ